MATCDYIARSFASLFRLYLAPQDRPGGDSSFDPLTATLSDIKRLLDDGTVNTAFLVQEYLAQIKNHTSSDARSVICIGDQMTLTELAYTLGDERDEGCTRGPLHGIPILISAEFRTHPSLGLHNTGGAKDLERPGIAQNDPIVDLLIRAGMVIIGKVNFCQEMSNEKGQRVKGWSATKCMLPIVIRERDCAKIITTASGAGLYGMTVSEIGLERSTQEDSAVSRTSGVLGRTPQDLAETRTLFDVSGAQTLRLGGDWKRLRIGIVGSRVKDMESGDRDPKPSQYWIPEEMGVAISRLSLAGADIRMLLPPSTSGDPALWESNFALNDPDAALRIPSDSETTRDLDQCLRQFIDFTFSSTKIDIIVTPAQSPWTTAALVARYSIGAVPLGILKPNGVSAIIARAGDGKSILGFMRAWEAVFPETRKLSEEV